MRRIIATVLFFGSMLMAPMTAQAACKMPDGSPAPEPVYSEEMANSRDWGPTVTALYAVASEGHKGVLWTLAKNPGSAVLTTKCSGSDLVFAHFAAVGVVGVDSEALKDAPDEVKELTRAYALTVRGAQTFPMILAAMHKHFLRQGGDAQKQEGESAPQQDNSDR